MGSMIFKSVNNKINKLKNECGNEAGPHHQKGCLESDYWENKLSIKPALSRGIA